MMLKNDENADFTLVQNNIILGEPFCMIQLAINDRNTSIFLHVEFILTEQ